MRIVPLLVIAIIAFGAAPADLVIHEWGTFTSLQNENGEALGAINVDDEPVPSFVHALPASFIANSPGADEIGAVTLTKGLFARHHPQITMRLETPVVYFYDKRPITGEKQPIELSVTFNGGYLSQFYPKADPGDAPKLPMRQPGQYVQITRDTKHVLTWKDLHIGTTTPGPVTDSKVWLAPRAVKADGITVGSESEKYLFYRGVGHLDSPLRVQVDWASGVANFAVQEVERNDWTRVPHLFLLDVRDGGMIAWRRLAEVKSHPLKDFQAPAQDITLKDADYQPENLAAVRKALREALIADGLFDDEADAMLNTWEASYFKQPGLRVLYIVPKAWTDRVLPLKVSAEASVTRVMVGRIDLVTPQQRELLATISKPADVKKLGRFAAALLNDEQKRNPSPRLDTLIRQMGMTPTSLVPQQ